MYKKLFITLGVLIALIFSFNICFATNTNIGNGLQNAANGVRNVVGGAENAVENAAKDISGASKEATGTMEQGANNAANTNHNNATHNNQTGTATTRTTNNTNTAGYTAKRTATGNATFMGMNATTWTWLVMGIAAIAIVALVWYYSMQMSNKRNHDNLD